MKRLPIALIALVLGALRVQPITDPDYHWHLATGRLVIERHTVPSVDPFSHTAAGARWTFVDWLADVIMFLVSRVAGDAGNQVLFALLGALGVALAAERASRHVPRANAFMLGAITLAVGAVVSFRITPRPQTVLFPLVAALLLVLDASRDNPRARYLPPAIILLWQNLHSSALVGVALVTAYVLGALAERRDRREWAAVWLGSIAALFLTVRPIERLRAGFAHLGDPRVAQLFPEWGSPFRQGVFGAWVLAALIILLFAGIGAAARGGTFGAWASLAIVTALGMTSARFLPLVALVAAPLALEGLVTMGERLRATPVSIVASLLAVLALSEHVRRPGFGLARDAFPEHAAKFVRERDLRGKLFNDFHFGGYLIWALADRSPVFVDGRSMAVYDVDFVRQAATAVDAQLDALIDRYGATIAIVPPDKRMGALQRRPGWGLVFFDDAAAVLVREDSVPGGSALTYRALAPGRWFDVEWFRAVPERLERAQVELVRARAEAPHSSVVAVLAVTVALAADDFAHADAALAEADAKFPGTNRVMRAHLVRCLEANDRACACAMAAKITRAFPSNTYAASARSIMNCP